jgi:hypothetical protein
MSNYFADTPDSFCSGFITLNACEANSLGVSRALMNNKAQLT